MPKLVQVGESVESRRAAYFDLRGTDGLSAASDEQGGQPQTSIDGSAWSDSGIGTLVLIGNGRYYAVLTTGAVAVAGSQIETRYKSANTIETPGDSYQVVGFDPADLLNMDGDGSVAWSITVEDVNKQPIEFVDVWVTTDQSGANPVAGVLKTDVAGQVVVQLNPGTYYLWRRHPAYNFSNPQTMVVS